LSEDKLEVRAPQGMDDARDRSLPTARGAVQEEKEAFEPDQGAAMTDSTTRKNDSDERNTGKPSEHNKAGHQEPTPRNEPRRTPESRHDRESHVGGGNQIRSRRGGLS
jgi:hypothetical protein